MDIITKLNWVDVLVVIIMLRTSYVAFQDGLSHEIVPSIAAFLGLILSLHYYKKLTDIMVQNIVSIPSAILDCLTFSILFFGIIILFRLIRAIFDTIVKITWHPFIEKLGGLLAGIFKATMITSAVLIILALIPLSYLKTSIRDKSLTGMYFLKIGPRIYAEASRVLPFVKLDGASFNTEYVINNIMIDKANEAKTKNKAKDGADWEKPFVKK